MEAEPRAQDTLNPYITNRPISDPSAFLGRKELLSWVQERMVKGDRILLLHGVWRIGKTSFLLQVPHQISAGYLAVRLDLHKTAHLASIETTSAESQAAFAWAFCQGVARQVTAAHTLPLNDPQLASFVRDLRYALREFLTDLRRVLGNNILLLMLDDLDALPAGGAEQQFIADLIEQALERWRGLRFLITARSLNGLPTERGWAQQVPVQRLGSLNSTEALDLLKSPAAGRLAYDPAAARRAAELASGHPYYLQLLGYTLFNRCLTSGEVSLPDVSAALEELLPLHFNEFDEWWKSSTPPEKVVLALLAELKGQGGVFTFYEVHKALTRQGVRIKHEIVEQALQSLAAREILEHLGAISYRVRIELFRVWLPHHANLQEALKAARWRVHRRPVPQAAQEIATEFTANRWLTWAIVTAAILVILFLIFRAPEAAKLQPTPSSTFSSLTTLTPPPSASAAIGPTTTTPLTTPTPTAIAGATLPSPTIAALPVTPDLPHKGRLLYMRKEKAQAPWQLYLMDADGTNPRAVTNDRLDAAYPAWSPNGLSLAFVSERDGNKEIYTMNLDGTGLTNLSRHLADDWTPTWSPDGQWIAFASFRDENWELYAVHTDGTDLVRLTENENSDLSPAWSPDGKMLAFASKRGGDWDIYLMPWHGTAVTRLTHGPGSNLSPAWSPDGQWIAFESTRDGNAEIYLMRADDSEQRNLTNWPYADEHGPVWSSDGQWIAFYSNRDGNWDIYVMDREGKNLTNLTDDDVNNQSPAWSP